MVGTPQTSRGAVAARLEGATKTLLLQSATGCYAWFVSLVPVRELRNNTAAVIERARRGEDVTITVNGVAAAKLVAVSPGKRRFLNTADLMAMRPKRGAVVPEYWDHELDGDTTDDLNPIE